MVLEGPGAWCRRGDSHHPPINDQTLADEQRRTAERAADRADSAATLAEARRVSTQALATEDYDRALLLAVEGRHLDDSTETRSNLLAAIRRSPDAVAVIRSDTEAFLDLGLTPDGTTLLASGVGGPSTLSTYDVTTRTPKGSISNGVPGCPAR